MRQRPDYSQYPSTSDPLYAQKYADWQKQPPIIVPEKPPKPSLRDKFDADPNNGDWRDDLLVIVGVICLLAFFSVIALASMAHREDVLFYVGITLLTLGIYVRVQGEKSRG